MFSPHQSTQIDIIQQSTVDMNGQQQSAELTLMSTSFCDQYIFSCKLQMWQIMNRPSWRRLDCHTDTLENELIHEFCLK